jgi:hypothetical protein
VRDLLVIVPSRGRPERLRAMITACLTQAEAGTDIAVAADEDDSSREAYARLRLEYSLMQSPPWPAAWHPLVRWHSGPRDTLAGWTNKIARQYAGEYRALASLGDDHVPRTVGWDGLLLEALDNLNDTGTGIAYGNDLHQGENLPTAPVISSDIVEALGWMCEPSLAHMCVDDVWRDLGRGAGCLAYVPQVVIEHLHPDAGKAATDDTYTGSLAGAGADREAYERWRQQRMADDVAKIRALTGPASMGGR